MDFFEVIRNRHSVREFQDKEVEDGVIEKILNTAKKAPSAGDLKAYEIFIVKDLEKRRALSAAAGGQESLLSAPVILVFAASPEKSAIKYNKRGEELYSVQDATIACAHAQLAVTTLGLASVWIGAFNEDQVSKIIGISNNIKPIAMLPIGYE